MSNWPRPSPSTSVVDAESEGAVRISMTLSKLDPETSVPSIRTSTSQGATRPLFQALPSLRTSCTRTPLSPLLRSSRIIPNGFSRSTEYSPSLSSGFEFNFELDFDSEVLQKRDRVP